MCLWLCFCVTLLISSKLKGGKPSFVECLNFISVAFFFLLHFVALCKLHKPKIVSTMQICNQWKWAMAFCVFFCFYFLYDSQLVCVDEIFFRCGIQWFGAQKVSPLVKKVASIACSMVGQLRHLRTIRSFCVLLATLLEAGRPYPNYVPNTMLYDFFIIILF